MAARCALCIIAFVALSLGNIPNDQVPPSSEWILRMEYKLSFKPPDIVAKDGSLPFWELSGHVIPSVDEVRLTASVPNQKGSMWTSKDYEATNWQFETVFRVTGKGQTGTDGLALWFISDKSDDTSVFGGPAKWNGLAVILDSVDNDNKGNNPLVAAFLNNGSHAYDIQRDGENQFHAYNLYDYRNKPFPIHLKVRYYHNVLTLEMSDGLTAVPAYQTWGVIENVRLPGRGFFGLTSSTGPLNPDDHDVYSFVVHSIVPRDHAMRQDAYYRKQMEEYTRKADEIHAAQMQYARQHPDKVHPSHYTGHDQPLSMGSQQDMRNLFEMQSDIRHVVDQIMSRLNEIVGRQEMNAASMAKLTKSLGAAAGSPSPMQTNAHEQLLRSQAEAAEASRRLMRDVQDILMRVSQLSPPSSQQSLNSNFLQSLMDKVTAVANRKQPSDEQKQNKVLWLVVILQTFTLGGTLLIIGRSKEMAKKFY